MPTRASTDTQVQALAGLHLYHGQLSNSSMRARLLLEEKRLPWTSHLLDPTKQDNLSESYLRVNPTSLIPALVHDGVVVTESSDILYCSSRHPATRTSRASRSLWRPGWYGCCGAAARSRTTPGPLEVVADAAIGQQLEPVSAPTRAAPTPPCTATTPNHHPRPRRPRDGSVAVEFEPIDFVGKLAALVPRPRSNLVRYHGCLAPHASLHAYVVEDGRGPPPSKAEITSMAATTMAVLRVESSAALSCAPPRERGLRWPELMQRVFASDVLLCPSCGRRMKPIAEITSRRVAQKMLEHVGVPSDAPEPWPARGPPGSLGAPHWLDHEPGADEPAPDFE